MCLLSNTISAHLCLNAPKFAIKARMARTMILSFPPTCLPCKPLVPVNQELALLATLSYKQTLLWSHLLDLQTTCTSEASSEAIIIIIKWQTFPNTSKLINNDVLLVNYLQVSQACQQSWFHHFLNHLLHLEDNCASQARMKAIRISPAWQRLAKLENYLQMFASNVLQVSQYTNVSRKDKFGNNCYFVFSRYLLNL